MIDTGIDGVRVFGRHLPEGVFDDRRRIVADAQFKKEELTSRAGAEEVFVPLRRPVPALILNKAVVGAEIHGHRPAAVRADGQQLSRDAHVLLPFDHFTDGSLIVKGLLTARSAALEKAVVTLHVEQPLFIKARLLKAMIHICRDNEIVLVGRQPQKSFIDRFRGVHIAIDIDVPAPVRPEFFPRREGVKAAAVHIPNAVLCREIGKEFFKALTVVGKARRGGKPCSGADHNGVTFPQGRCQPRDLL